MMFLRGDRVVCTADEPDGNVNIHNGDTGVVLADQRLGSDWVKVRWDHAVGGHDCDRLCEHGYGWETPEDYLRLEKEDLLPDASEIDDFLRNIGYAL